MDAPSIHYRIVNADFGNFTDQVKYATKADAQAQCNTIITTQGGPTMLYVYELSGCVCVATSDLDAI